MDYSNMTPKEVRQLIRDEKITNHTDGMCLGFAQANLIVLPRKYAFDFLLFATRNPAPCPILEVCETRFSKTCAVGADIASDIPKYRIWKNGRLVGECTNVRDIWQDDFVSFLIGCSFSFESDLLEADIPVRHIEEGKNVPMYVTNIPLNPAGIFKGNMVVSMRPMTEQDAIRATVITSNMPKVHGKPIHIGDPQKIGINDINKPDFGDSVTVRAGEIPVFWPCGVTPQVAVMAACPDFAITHSPGHMLITDIKNSLLKN